MIDSRERSQLDRLIPLIDVKRMLAVSWPTLIEMIHTGRLTTYDIMGRTVDRTQVNEDTRALRVFESDLQRFIDSIRVR